MSTLPLVATRTAHLTNVRRGAAHALEQANELSEGIASDYLRDFLELNLPKPNKKNKLVLGVSDKNLAGSIKASFPAFNYETGDTNEVVQDLLRGLRLHSGKLLRKLQDGDLERAQLGLGHAYSRARVKFSVQKNDNHIIQAIATLDHLDKAINTFSMRVREWYSWHFPELIRVVSENQLYARVVLFIGDKKTLTDDRLHDLAAIVNDDGSIAQSVIDVAKVSMGQDVSQADLDNISAFARRVVALSAYRKTLYSYLVAKMAVVAPNLATLIGEVVGARLISHAGSLTNLSKYPASTVQILGAEKALFRALKTKGNTPKYGLIYHSTFIGRAGQKNKGRISRFLANKCSIASRIDNFSEAPTTKFGEVLRGQVEERLEFYASGAAPTKNEVAMVSRLSDVSHSLPTATDPQQKKAMDSVLADINVDVDMEDRALVASSEPARKGKKGEKAKKKKDETDGKENEKVEKKKRKKRDEGQPADELADDGPNQKGGDEMEIVQSAQDEATKKKVSKKRKQAADEGDRDADGKKQKRKSKRAT